MFSFTPFFNFLASKIENQKQHFGIKTEVNPVLVVATLIMSRFVCFTEENECKSGDKSLEKGVVAAGSGEGDFLYLKTKGQLSQVKTSFSERKVADGLIRSIRNFPMRGNEWKFTCSCSNTSSGVFAVADDHGQVYVVDPANNSYRLVRSASAGVSAMQYLPCRDNQLLGTFDRHP